jgi:hypothetical protein
MRSKGPIWESALQNLIVESYRGGMLVDDILSLPRVAPLGVSPFTIRSILKHNKIRPTNNRRKRKDDLWSSAVVQAVVTERNYGHTINKTLEHVNLQFPKIGMKRSTLVRILEDNEESITYRFGDVPDIWSADVLERVVDLYQEGKTVADICKHEIFRGLLVNERAVRNILKSEGVQLTSKKGKLRRWPAELQQRIVHLYQEGCTFDEIKAEPEIASNNPTDYAIRNILKQHDITTRRAINFREKISDARYRRYRDGKMNPNEISLVHKHLARFEEGRNQMQKRMGLLPEGNVFTEFEQYDELLIIEKNSKSWAMFFQWAMRYLYSDSLKRHIFEIGLEFSRAMSYYRRVIKEGDSEKRARTYQRLQDCITDMQAVVAEVIKQPLSSVKIKSLR